MSEPHISIILIDDVPECAGGLREQLESHFSKGIDFEVATSGAEALEYMQEAMDEGRHVAVVISDYIMPGLMGHEVLQQMHRQSPDTVKIIYSGVPELVPRQEAKLAFPLYALLSKPWREDQMVAVVRRALAAYLGVSETATAA